MKASVLQLPNKTLIAWLLNDTVREKFAFWFAYREESIPLLQIRNVMRMANEKGMYRDL